VKNSARRRAGGGSSISAWHEYHRKSASKENVGKNGIVTGKKNGGAGIAAGIISISIGRP